MANVPCLNLIVSALSLAHDLRNEPLDRLMLGVTWLGSLWLLLPLTVLTAALLYWRVVGARRIRPAGFVEHVGLEPRRQALGVAAAPRSFSTWFAHA